MTDLERLIAIEEIKRLKARYFRCIDMKDWDELAMVFAVDAVFDATDARRSGPGNDTLFEKQGAAWVNTGRSHIVDFIRRTTEAVSTVHHGHMPEIEVLDKTEARGVWAMEDFNKTIVNGKLLRSLHGFGHYWDSYECVGGIWFIKTSRLTRIRAKIDVSE